MKQGTKHRNQKGKTEHIKKGINRETHRNTKTHKQTNKYIKTELNKYRKT